MTGLLGDGTIPIGTFLISVVLAGIGGAYLQSKLSGTRSNTTRNRKIDDDKKVTAVSGIANDSTEVLKKNDDSGDHDDDEGEDEDEDEDEDDEEEDNYSEGQIRNNYGMMDAPFKMLLCVNMELSMGKGKIAAQCGHATLGAFRLSQKHCNTALTWWHRTGQAKIAVKVEKESDLSIIENKAREAGLITYQVEDAGRTQIAAGSRTVLAIGPAPASVFANVTGHLKLL